MTQRRRSRRYQTNRRARCRLSAVDAVWRDCRVIDASASGVGLEIDDATSVRLLEGIVVERRHPVIDTSIEVRGQIRNAQPTANGGLRVGVALVGVGAEARGALQQLAGLVHA